MRNKMIALSAGFKMYSYISDRQSLGLQRIYGWAYTPDRKYDAR